jgi:signal transduction histidine kinase
MESIGRLAGGVAHDFNNMLSVILSDTELLLAKLPPQDPLRAEIEEIAGAAARSAELTRQLLGFASRQRIAPRIVDLQQAVSATMSLLERLVGENVKLSWEPSPGLWTIRIDPAQLDQIFTNLCVNARDAIANVGRIRIAAENRSVPADGVDGAHLLGPGDYVRVTVTDDGRGMDAETLAHIFEPFFTTKGPGKGTGLGLATVYGIVQQNGGAISARSAPGEGTTFTIDLPRCIEAATAVRRGITPP